LDQSNSDRRHPQGGFEVTRVLALDPGDRVGWAYATIAEDGAWSDVAHGIEDLKPLALRVYHAVTMGEPLEQRNDCPRGGFDVVVCERWALYPHMAKVLVGSEIPSAQFIGMVKLSCWLAGVPLVMQPASRVNSNQPGVMAPAERSMKKLRPELFELVTQPIAHDDGHDLVAIKHLWAYTFDNYPVRRTDDTTD
jgi:hypothetical protein